MRARVRLPEPRPHQAVAGHRVWNASAGQDRSVHRPQRRKDEGEGKYRNCGAAETLQGGLCRDRQCVRIKRGVRIYDFLKWQSIKISEIGACVQKEHGYESPYE